MSLEGSVATSLLHHSLKNKTSRGHSPCWFWELCNLNWISLAVVFSKCPPYLLSGSLELLIPLSLLITLFGIRITPCCSQQACCMFVDVCALFFVSLQTSWMISWFLLWREDILTKRVPFGLTGFNDWFLVSTAKISDLYEVKIPLNTLNKVKKKQAWKL